MKKAAFSFLTILILAVAIEALLRIAAPILRFDADQEVVEEGKDKIRILALGESTTDDYWSEQELGSWPRQLETMLNKKGYQVKSFNVARGGTTTTFILSHLDDYLAKYKPHIVISMMGTNDSDRLIYEGESLNLSHPTSFFHSLKIVKIFKWLIRENSEQNTKLSTADPKDSYTVGKMLQETKLKDLSQIHWGPAARNNCEESVYYRRAAVIDYDLLKHGKTIEYHRYMTRKALRMCPGHGKNLFWYYHFNSLTESGRKNCREDFKFVQRYLKLIPDEALNNLIKCFYDTEQPLALRNLLAAKGITFSKDYYHAAKRNYQILNQKLVDRGIVHVAMQYPTVHIQQLKNYFPKKAKVIFVENRENFKPYLGERYDEIFVDRFRKTWGHTNMKGHTLIARQLVAPVEDIIKNLKL